MCVCVCVCVGGGDPNAGREADKKQTEHRETLEQGKTELNNGGMALAMTNRNGITLS